MKYQFLLLLLLFFLKSQSSLTQYKVTTKQIESTYIKFGLQYTGTQDFYVKEKSKIVKNLVFLLKCYSHKHFDFKIYDALQSRYEVPQGGIFPKDQYADYSYPINFADFTFEYTQNPFSFKITKKDHGSILFSSDASQIIFSDYYIQIGTHTSSKYIYGFSERFTNNFRLLPGKWTMFPRDRGQMMDTGIGKQTHGYYPIYLQRDNNGAFHMNYFRSSNALDVIVEEGQADNYILTYKVIGGIIDFRFFLGVYPDEVLQQFQRNILGRSAIPPFWSLGFHQCRWGYNNSEALFNVLKGYKQNDIPLDTIWTDIDYMKEYETFTIDEDRFPLDQMKKIIEEYHYIPIIEPSIRLGKGYAYDQGKQRNVFIQDAEHNDQIGKVWAGQVVFTDYFHPNATQYWIDMLQSLYDKIQFSGVWLDMNQISNLCNGPCSPPTQTGMDFTNDLPYHPGNDTIQTQAIPLNATHYGNRLEADYHTFFGFMETYATNQFLSLKGRPFIITRSNTLGSNRYGFHWTGDNFANYDYLKTSISSNFMFSMWGIQMVGSDICGFGGNATDQLCARWFQLGSLYPFARNHNQIQAIDQEPYALGELTLQSSKKNLKLRYSILKAYYTEFVTSKGFSTIFKPLFFQFPNDELTYHDEVANSQFLVGNFLMSAPILEQNQTKREVYFPLTGKFWYDYHTGKPYQSGSVSTIQNSADELVPLFLRQYHLIFQQNTANVLKSSQLTNRFIVKGAYAFRPSESNQTFKSYKAFGKTLSIQNYNDESKISQCIKNDCTYQFSAILQIDLESNKRILQLHHIGYGASPQQTILVEGLVIYYQDKVIKKNLQDPIQFYGNQIIYFIDLGSLNLKQE